MLPVGQWSEVVAGLHGTIYRGTERIACASIFDLLQVSKSPEARRQAGKSLVSVMRSHGWTGPKHMRIQLKEAGAGYWRFPFKPPQRVEAVDPEVDCALVDDLPTALEHVTRTGLRKLNAVLRRPLDVDNAGLLRSQITAAGIAINAQLRADEQRLRAKVTGDVLERLLRVIEKERGQVDRLIDGSKEGEAE